MIRKHLLSAVAALTIVGAANATEWQIDPGHSSVGFTVKHMVVQTVRGQFTDFEASLTFDPAHPEKIEAEVTINAATITTNNEKRDKHLLSPDFFDVANYPNITFKATKAKSLGDNKYRVTGDLTINGRTKSIDLEGEGFGTSYKNPWGQFVSVVSMRATINREDFNVMWNKPLEQGGLLVSKEVTLEIDLELAKK